MSSPATLAFDSINSSNPLTGYITAVSHETVQVLGYYSPGDGGGGEFYWDSLSTVAADGGSVIATSLTTGRWKRIFTNFQISVKAFGAKGDNTADDSSAINAAAAYCATLVNNKPSTATLYFPPALGYITSTRISVKSYISVWMESFLNLNDATFSNVCLEIGETGILNSSLDCRINVHNRIASPWGNNTNCIGVNFINLSSSNIKLDYIIGFTIGCQLKSDVACTGNNFIVGSILDNQRALSFTTSGTGFVNENVFIGGNYACSSNTSVSPYNTQSRWGVYALAPGSMNQNVFYKPCFQLGASALLPGVSNVTAIGTFKFASGSAYTNGSYSNVPLTGGTGTGATATIIVSANKVTSVQLSITGIGYTVGDVLSTAASNIGGTGSGFNLTVIALVVSLTSLSVYSITSPGTGYTTGTYTNVPLTGGTGTGAAATIIVSGGGVTSVQLSAIGIGYTVGDALSAAASSIGGTGSGFSLTVTIVSGGALAVPAYLDNARYFAFNNCRVESCSNTIAQVRNAALGNMFTIDYFNNLTISDPELAVDDTSAVRNTLVKFYWLPETTGADTLIYQSPFLVNALAPYGANLYNIKGLDWAKRTDGSVINGSTLTSVGPDYIELSGSDAYCPSVTINTVSTKRFLVKYDTVAVSPGFGGRIFINCYDSVNNAIPIDPTTLGDLVLWNYAALSKSTAFGNSYGLQSDINSALSSQFFFNVGLSVAKIRIIFSSGTQNLKIRQFSVYSLDGKSQSGYSSNMQTDNFIGLASSLPAVAYPKGTFVKNDFSSDLKSQFWYNSNGLSTGWKTSNDFNNLINNPIYSGTGSPNGTVTAPVGSLYLDIVGGAGTTLYVKESGTGNTGWVNK